MGAGGREGGREGERESGREEVCARGRGGGGRRIDTRKRTSGEEVAREVRILAMAAPGPRPTHSSSTAAAASRPSTTITGPDTCELCAHGRI